MTAKQAHVTVALFLHLFIHPCGYLNFSKTLSWRCQGYTANCLNVRMTLKKEIEWKSMYESVSLSLTEVQARAHTRKRRGHMLTFLSILVLVTVSTFENYFYLNYEH